MDLIKDKKFLFMLAVFIVLGAGIVLLPTHSGIFLMIGLVLYGSLCLLWKESNIKLAGLAFLVLLSLFNIGINGLKFGIDFSGGTRIPVILEQTVNAETMNEMVQTIKSRVAVLGLKEAKVRAIGSSQINVEIPGGSGKDIEFIENTLSKQGVYWGIVDGKIAISGESIFSSSIRPVNPQSLVYNNYDWGVEFSIDKEGAQQFGNVAKGKPNYPVYMFLDRPTDAVLFISRADLRRNMVDDSNERESVNAIKKALTLDKNRNISIVILEDMNNSITPKTNKTKAIIATNTSQTIKDKLKTAGFVLQESKEPSPEYIRLQAGGGELILTKLESVGLMSSPTLGVELTNGNPVYMMQIGGGIVGTQSEKTKLANERTKYITSILKGGSLPVQISLGSRTTLPASLGGEFLKLSLIGIVSALIAISLLIGLRYRNLRATLPIIVISTSELVILLSIIGSFTIDLAAMAGIIAAIGVGVDAQIVITDEILKKDEERTEDKIQYAFAIIKTNVIVATLSMIPLLFSNLVEVIGFAISTILGSLLGYLLSRPAYAAIVKMIVGDAAEN